MSITGVFLTGMVAGVGLVIALACILGVYFADNIIDEKEEKS
jgi:uncharacterized FAD-dependent dehydrogenase